MGPGGERLIGRQGLTQMSDASKTPIVIADSTGVTGIWHIPAARALVGQFTYEAVRADEPNPEVASVGMIGSEVNLDELEIRDFTVWGQHDICNNAPRDARTGTVGD